MYLLTYTKVSDKRAFLITYLLWKTFPPSFPFFIKQTRKKSIILAIFNVIKKKYLLSILVNFGYTFILV